MQNKNDTKQIKQRKIYRSFSPIISAKIEALLQQSRLYRQFISDVPALPSPQRRALVALSEWTRKHKIPVPLSIEDSLLLYYVTSERKNSQPSEHAWRRQRHISFYENDLCWVIMFYFFIICCIVLGVELNCLHHCILLHYIVKKFKKI